ncbi:MAG TPA: tetratricopeptide repeat protein [Pyrinomonadaceae bacterium]|jgi:tetratricopeptide (TPR) repeat protein|nr:tetratricopeptide repeat protein [Pyrinomonadaceae bacterium]
MRNPELASAYSKRGLAWTNYAPDAKSAAADPKSASVRTAMFGKAIVDLKKSVELYEKQMNAKQADEDLKEACAKTYNNLGWAYEELEDYDSAVEHYDNAIKVNPKHYFSYTGKGDALRKGRKFDAASAAYEQVIQTSESSASDKFVAYEGQGLVFFTKCRGCDSVRRKSDLERSISMFDAALKIASDAKVSREARDRVSHELNVARSALESHGSN